MVRIGVRKRLKCNRRIEGKRRGFVIGGNLSLRQRIMGGKGKVCPLRKMTMTFYISDTKAHSDLGHKLLG